MKARRRPVKIQHWNTNWLDEGHGIREDLRPYRRLDAQANPRPPANYQFYTDPVDGQPTSGRWGLDPTGTNYVWTGTGPTLGKRLPK